MSGFSEEMQRAERVWAEVEKKLKPAVMEIAVRRDSGPLVVQFGSGEFKEATASRKL